MSRIETLATLPIDKRRGANTVITIAKITTSRTGIEKIVVALSPEREDATAQVEQAGIVIGTGPTRIAALADAQSTLQAALDSVDVAIIKGSRS